MEYIRQFLWALSIPYLYGRFFRPRCKKEGPLAALAPALVWFLFLKLTDRFIVIEWYDNAYDTFSIKNLTKVSVLYGMLCLTGKLFYRSDANSRLFVLITALLVSVSEIARFFSYSLSCFWNCLYDFSVLLFETGWLRLSAEEYLLLIHGIAMAQLFLLDICFIATLFFPCRYIIRVYIRKDQPLHKTEFWFLMLPCVIGFLFCYLLRVILIITADTMPEFLFDRFPVLLGIVPVLLILCLISMLYSIKLYQEMLALNVERGQRIALEKQLVSLEEHTREVERVYSGVRAMKHDIKNQLAAMAGLSGRRQEDELSVYLEQLNRTVNALDFPFQTGSAVADSLLAMKYHEIHELLPMLTFDADSLIFPSCLAIQPTDISVILGNAIDNAMEACIRLGKEERGEEAFIRISSLYRQSMLILTVENSFSGKLSVRPGEDFPTTQKPDAQAHGIGMYSIRSAAQKYHGRAEWSASDGVFTLTVMLENSSPVETHYS